MADDRDRPEDAAANDAAGVLGNLPRTRPSVRSPRRKAAAEAPNPAPAAQPDAAPEGKPAPLETLPEPTGPGSDLEGLARTGIALAGGAASLGLRIAGRAASAVRDAVERR
jgi:hypothetical protein